MINVLVVGFSPSAAVELDSPLPPQPITAGTSLEPGEVLARTKGAGKSRAALKVPALAGMFFEIGLTYLAIWPISQ